MQLEDKLMKQSVLIKLAKILKKYKFLDNYGKIGLYYTILPQYLWGNLF